MPKWKQGDKIYCNSPTGLTCSPAKFECGSISEFHTERLEATTRDLNAILEEVAKDDKDRPLGADLSILETPDGLFLAWTQSNGEGVAIDNADKIDNADEIRKFLGTYDCPSQQN